jgi:hypothetical protein
MNRCFSINPSAKKMLWMFVLLFQVGKGYTQSSKKIEIGLCVNPNLSFSINEHALNKQIEKEVGHKLASGNVPIAKVDAGINLKYQLSEKMKIGIGVIFSLKERRYYFWAQEATSTSYNSYTNTLSYTYQLARTDIQLKTTFIEVPLFINYILYNKSSVNFYLSGGLISQYLINYKIAVSYKDQNLVNTNSRRDLFIGTQLGCGIQKYIGENLSLCLEPTFKSSHLSINEGRLKSHFSSIGLNVLVNVKI